MTNPLTLEEREELRRPVLGFEGYYTVSADGEVYRVAPGGKCGALKPRNSRGYKRVTLSKNGKQTQKFVHHLVLDAFYGPRPPGLEASHLDGDRGNNNVLNLAWMTRASNAAHRISHDTQVRGSDTYNARLTEDIVRAIRKDNRPLKAIAQHYRVGEYTVFAAKKGITWRHVE